MASRLNPFPLFRGVVSGLRHRDEDITAESYDKLTIAVLVVIPAAVAALIIVFDVKIDAPDQLLAGTALMAGALLTGFSQVAAWRERILLRDEQARTRALDEAAAHILVSLLAALLITGLVVGLTLLPKDGLMWGAVNVGLIFGALAIGTLAYVGITVYIVANLLWDALQFEKDDASRQALKDLPGDE